MNITETSNTSKYDNSGYYLTPDLSQRLDLISHLLANTTLIPYIQAGEGSGKTRLLDHLAETLNERYTIFTIEGDSGLSLKALRAELSMATGAAEHEVIEDEALAEQINSLDAQNKTLLILVDDADQLPADTLTWLMETFDERKEAIRNKLVIFAAVDVLALPLSPVLLSKLNDSIQSLDIPNITAEQLPGFVASIDPLKSAVLDEAQYASLMKNTSGVAGRILWHLQYLDNSATPHQEPVNDSANRMKPVYLVAGILFVSALASVLIFQDEINRKITEDNAENEDSTQLEIKPLQLPPPVVALNKEDKPSEESLPPEEQKPDRELEVTAEALQQLPKIATPAAQGQPETAMAEKVLAEAEPVAENDTELKLEPEPQPQQKPKDETVEEKPEVLVNNEAAPKLKKSESEKPKSDKAESEKAQPVTTETANLNPINPVVEKNPVANVKPKPLPAPKPAAVMQSVEWITNQTDKTYTLQLLAVSEEKGIKRFLALHEFDGNLVILKTKRKGKPWYALLYETYASRDEALNARKKLPKSYKASSAWPRSILSLRQAISAN